MMNRRALSEAVLLDSFATLRHADRIVREVNGLDSDEAGEATGDIAPPPPSGVPLPDVLLRAYREILGILGSLRQSRVLIERTTMERLRRTHEKLREVSSATEIAATDMLNGLDHAIGLVDRLDHEAESGEAAVTRRELRDELFRLITVLQFQDITAQQLTYASNVLDDLESRLDAVVQLFDANGVADATASHNHDSHALAYDPHASTRDADARQALADEIFVRGENGHSQLP